MGWVEGVIRYNDFFVGKSVVLCFVVGSCVFGICLIDGLFLEVFNICCFGFVVGVIDIFEGYFGC